MADGKDEKSIVRDDIAPAYVEDYEEHYKLAPETAEDFVTEVIHARDDPTLNPWTFRTLFLGTGLATLGAVLATIYYFKPQTVVVSTVFLAVISYTWLGRFLNPHPFNSKEHAVIIIVGSAARNAPAAIELLAVQKLFYNEESTPAVGIFPVFASQCLGYGIAGLLRRTLVYPTKMLFPTTSQCQVKKKLHVFYIGFLVLFFYEIIPEFIMPILVGISFFCLAKRNSLLFTNLFRGSNGNEGLGIMGLSFDWHFVGYVLCVGVFTGVYYGNIWRAQDFPFLSQLLFIGESNGTTFIQYNQTAILNESGEVDLILPAQQGLPYFAVTFAFYIPAINFSITATSIHLWLWNWVGIKSALDFISLANLIHLVSPRKWNWRFWTARDSRSGIADTEHDPHFRLMLQYKDAPDWWYGIIFVIYVAIGFTMMYPTNSTLPWWAFFIACGLSCIYILFFGAQYAMTGYQYDTQPVIQMIGGYLHPGFPKANMFFVVFEVGQLLEVLFSYIPMSSITTNKRDLSVRLLRFLHRLHAPVPFWIAHKYFPKMRWDYWNTAIIAKFIGLLYVGINSVTMPWFHVRVISQFYMRKYRPNWFIDAGNAITEIHFKCTDLFNVYSFNIKIIDF
ncbi:OPT superfamily oligopeptide transporter [Acephala macrosclerotiorum]|nr:OPT superfamily oligopeptide transporter [Acephala macrosclerotiorum]